MVCNLRFAFLAFILCVAPSAVAAPYINGWTESAAQEYVRGCVLSSSERQIKQMLHSGQIPAGATDAEIDDVRKFVTPIVTAICSCAQQRAMNDFTLDEFARRGRQPAYMTEIMTVCTEETLQARKLSGTNVAPTAPTAPTPVAPESAPSAGDIGYKTGVLVGFLCPILAILIVVGLVLWLIFRRPKVKRDNHRSGW
jgi:hypothetical protein